MVAGLIQVNQEELASYLDSVVRGTVEETLTSDVAWKMTYNDLNQLTLRQHYSILWSSGGTGFVNKWVYTYDDNGNVVVMSRQNVSSVQQDKWDYTWNPRDQMTKAEKRTGTGSGTYAGKVEYRYCLACDGALSERIEYSPTVSTTIVSWKRYEYDGLNLVRVDDESIRV